MNQLEKIVADRSLCEKLGKEWRDTAFISYKNWKGVWLLKERKSIAKHLILKKAIPRPIFAEVWAKLPDKVDLSPLDCGKNGKIFYICYPVVSKTFTSPKPVNAALKLYEWCKEQGYVK